MHRIKFIHVLSCQNMYTWTYNIHIRMRHDNNSFLGEKSICCQHATRRTTNEIWIMIIAWWYSNKFLSLPIILFSFYFILFTCLPVSPCGDYLPAGYESHEMRWLFVCRIWIAWVFWSCRVDVDNPYVLVLEIKIEKRKW